MRGEARISSVDLLEAERSKRWITLALVRFRR